MNVIKEKRAAIPGWILKTLTRGEKVRVYMKYGDYCGEVYWDGNKLRILVKVDNDYRSTV